MSSPVQKQNSVLRIKRVGDRGVHLSLPRYETAGAAGLDLRADRTTYIAPGHVQTVPTGVSVELPVGYEATVRPRSGLARHKGVVAVLGTIDADYRGEVGVLLANSGPEGVTIERGDRIAQLVVTPVARVEVVEVQELSQTDRGEAGFGSTGTK